MIKEWHDVCIEVWGRFACFTRPDLKVERVSYDVMTPSAARNIVQAIYWHPGCKYQVTKIEVLKPIKRIQMMRNELKSKMSPYSVMRGAPKGSPLYISRRSDVMQRSSVILKDVKYRIHVKVQLSSKANDTDNIPKFVDQLTRRARKGQSYYPLYLGCKEYPAYFRLVEETEPEEHIHEDQELGLMLYDMDYTNKENITPMYFVANMKDGVIDLEDVKLYK